MKMLHVIAAAAVLSTAAFAQTATTTTGTAPAEAKYSTVSKDEMFSSKLEGLNITNLESATVGEITDIATKNENIDAFILSVGGFFGMGERYVTRSPA